ncbi:PKD domain-containing protein [Halalkalicoccus sp. NIPERK01]|uniref:PKD domain-containing protein n=1 Tax=Halalkalicoccus sp. NIPERK01 TaxID=3053469 RepID=UPI00256F1DCE|nr:PKD domain-containing protein [Halalkalicoccus sp. NIPERK01]MDL5363357.1 PKD domain-containing protein [Halalkalicoccus sp. NIPERK01]
MPLGKIAVKPPVSKCSTSIVTELQKPGSTVKIFADGNKIAEGVASYSAHETAVDENIELEPGQNITAIQEVNNEISPESDPVKVQKVDADNFSHLYFSEPVFECSECVGVFPIVAGGSVEVTGEDSDEPRGTGTASLQADYAHVDLNPATGDSEQLTARQTACGETSEGYKSNHSWTPPKYSENKVPRPSIEPAMGCDTFVRITDVLPGAYVTFERSEGDSIKSCWTVRQGDYFGIPELKEGETLRAYQEFNICELYSDSTEITVGETNPPTPYIEYDAGICVGAERVLISKVRTGCELTLFLDDEILGEYVIPPNTTVFPIPVPTLTEGTLSAKQKLCGVEGELSNEVIVAPNTSPLPSNPVIPETLYACSRYVYVEVPQGTFVEIWSEMADAAIGTGLAANSDGVQVEVTPLLIKGDKITARATACGEQKESQAKSVKEFTDVLSSPHIPECELEPYARSIPVTKFVPGAHIEIILNNQVRGAKFTSNADIGPSGPYTRVPISVPLEEFEHAVSAQQRICQHTMWSNVVTVPPGKPTANFKTEQEKIIAGENIQFYDLSGGEINKYKWDFGDSTTSTERNPTHTYQSPGQRKVSLKVKNNCHSDTKKRKITVYPEEPELPQVRKIIFRACYGGQHRLEVRYKKRQSPTEDWDLLPYTVFDEIPNAYSLDDYPFGCCDYNPWNDLVFELDHGYEYRILVLDYSNEDPLFPTKVWPPIQAEAEFLGNSSGTVREEKVKVGGIDDNVLPCQT